MPRNAVQFQKGYSLAEFLSEYGTEEQCAEALFGWRWPDGFVCAQCGYTGYCALHTRALFQCHRCHHQVSVTAGTIFAHTKLALSTWFLAMYLLTQTKNGVSALELSRQLGVSYNTAWSMKHKLMQVMKERDDARPLGGLIELDDAYWGGERSGGKRGRGAEGKTPFVAAVATTEDGSPVAMRLSCVKGFSTAALTAWAAKHLAPGSTVVSDGLACFAAVTTVGCAHHPIVTGGGRASVELTAFTWVNTMLGNVKRSLDGTYHAVSAKHLPRYLAEFCYRFNRRFDLRQLISRLAYAAMRTPPMPARLLKMAEVHW